VRSNFSQKAAVPSNLCHWARKYILRLRWLAGVHPAVIAEVQPALLLRGDFRGKGRLRPAVKPELCRRRAAAPVRLTEI
jgi:hypothetical protein